MYVEQKEKEKQYISESVMFATTMGVCVNSRYVKNDKQETLLVCITYSHSFYPY